MTCSGPEGGMIFLKNSASCQEITFESDIFPMTVKGDKWKVCGIAIVQDDKNFWALNMMESPDNEGKVHLVELKEMRDGRWGSEDNLHANAELNNIGLKWEYKTSYRMKIALNAEGICGLIMDKGGKVLSEISFKFNKAESVKSGKPALNVSGMDTSFDNVEIKGK
jgi:hypothetical protein